MSETSDATCDWLIRGTPWRTCNAVATMALTVTRPDGSGYVRHSCDEHLPRMVSVMLQGGMGQAGADSVSVSRPKNRPPEGGTP